MNGIQTDTQALVNRLDMIIKNRTGETCLLIDIATPSDRNELEKVKVKVQVKVKSSLCFK
jgi:hypothetical protein